MQTSNRILCVVRLLIAMITFGIQFPDPARGAEDAENVLESFDVASDGDGLLIPVTINGEEYSFLVNTGSNGILVDPKKTPALPLLGKRDRLDGGEERPLCSLPNAFVGKLRIPVGVEALQVDLSSIRKVSGHGVCGYLGMSFLRAHILEIDGDRGKLSFLRSVPDSAGRAFALFRDRLDRPMLAIDVAGDDPIPFLVDTGFRGVGVGASLRNARFEQLYLQGQIELHQGESISVVTGVGYDRKRRGWLREFSLGDTTHRRIGVAEGNVSALGLGFLSRYIATFDFPNQQLYLKPGKRFADPDRIDMSGLHIWRDDGDGVEIAGVDANSPASKVGLNAGDRILTYDGKKVQSISLFKLRTLFATEGRKIKLDVENSDERREVILDLPRLKKSTTQAAPRK